MKRKVKGKFKRRIVNPQDLIPKKLIVKTELKRLERKNVIVVLSNLINKYANVRTYGILILQDDLYVVYNSDIPSTNKKVALFHIEDVDSINENTIILKIAKK